MMPGWPETASAKLPSNSGDVTLYGFHVGLVDRSFTVTYVDYGSVNEALTDKAFDGGRDRMLSETKAKLISEKKIKLKDYPGREWCLLYEEKLAYVRSYIVGNRLYTMYTEGETDKTQSDETKKFFSSFKLIEK